MGLSTLAIKHGGSTRRICVSSIELLLLLKNSSIEIKRLFCEWYAKTFVMRYNELAKAYSSEII